MSRDFIRRCSFVHNLKHILSFRLIKKAAESYCSRYISLFDNTVFKGARIGIYEHSSAGRDFITIFLKRLVQM